MATAALQRLQKEMTNIRREPPPLCTAEPLSDGDLYKWKATVKGPDDTPYKGGTFKLKIDIPPEYPFKPPHVKFVTKIHHANIDAQSGEICLDVLYNKWTPGMTISSLLVSICSLLGDPNFHGAPIDLDKYKRKAVAWTKQYATVA